MIVDVHCGWGPTSAAPNWNDAAAVRAALAERGIKGACIASTLARRYDMLAGNETVAKIVAENEGESGLRGWLVLHPDQHEEASKLMRRHLVKSGFVGVALYPDPASGEPVTLERHRELLNVFRRYSKALLIAAPSALAMHHVVEISQYMGTTKILASGMGGEEWRSAVNLAARPSNLFLDFSGVLDSGKIQYAIRQMNGLRRIVFGSGAPATEPAAVLALLDDLELGADERNRICGTNAQRLFGETQGGGVDNESSARLAPMGD